MGCTQQQVHKYQEHFLDIPKGVKVEFWVKKLQSDNSINIYYIEPGDKNKGVSSFHVGSLFTKSLFSKKESKSVEVQISASKKVILQIVNRFSDVAFTTILKNTFEYQFTAGKNYRIEIVNMKEKGVFRDFKCDLDIHEVLPNGDSKRVDYIRYKK